MLQTLNIGSWSIEGIPEELLYWWCDSEPFTAFPRTRQSLSNPGDRFDPHVPAQAQLVRNLTEPRLLCAQIRLNGSSL